MDNLFVKMTRPFASTGSCAMIGRHPAVGVLPGGRQCATPAIAKFKLSTDNPNLLMKALGHKLLYLWALPTTAVGLLLAVIALLSGGRARWHTGVLEVHGGFATYFLRHLTLLPGGAAAITFGHVVVGRDPYCLDRTRTHERVHVRQVERWGPLFLPAYGIASLIAKLRGGDAYHDNAFEREAYAIDTP